MPTDPLNLSQPLGTLSAEPHSLHSSTQSLRVKPAAQGWAQCCPPWLPRPCDCGPGVGGQVQVPASLLNLVRPCGLWGATPQHQEHGGGPDPLQAPWNPGQGAGSRQNSHDTSTPSNCSPQCPGPWQPSDSSAPPPAENEARGPCLRSPGATWLAALTPALLCPTGWSGRACLHLCPVHRHLSAGGHKHLARKSSVGDFWLTPPFKSDLATHP